MNTDLRKKAKNDIGKDFFKLMNNAVFGKTMENVRKYRDLKSYNRKKKKLFGVRTKLSYCKVVTENLLAIEMKEKKKLRCLRINLSIQDFQ